MPYLEIEHLSKRLGERFSLEDVSFRAEKGQLVAVIGPSGSGKTTLLRTILGEHQPDEGSIRIGGEEVAGVPPERKGIGVVYQGYALFPHMTAAQNIAYGLRVRRRPKEEIDKKVAELLAMVRLEDRADTYPLHLSGGEKQRVAMARALAIEPHLLLLDEAFTALDAATKLDLVQEVRSIIKRLRLTAVIVTHDQEVAFAFADHIVVLAGGRVVTAGTATEVMAHEDPFIQDFVKVAVFEEARVETGHGGRLFARLSSGALLGVDVPGVNPGETVRVMVKRGRRSSSFEVWRHEDGGT